MTIKGKSGRKRRDSPPAMKELTRQEMAEHLSGEQIAARFLGALEGQENIFVEAHLKVCPTCWAELQSLYEAVGLSIENSPSQREAGSS